MQWDVFSVTKLMVHCVFSAVNTHLLYKESTSFLNLRLVYDIH
jgi:hypothetical protein